jgi:hypothetical protein
MGHSYKEGDELHQRPTYNTFHSAQIMMTSDAAGGKVWAFDVWRMQKLFRGIYGVGSRELNVWKVIEFGFYSGFLRVEPWFSGFEKKPEKNNISSLYPNRPLIITEAITHNIYHTQLLVYFNWLHSGWQKRFHIKDFYNRDSVFPESSIIILQNINSNMKMTDQGMNLRIISLRRKGPCEGNIPKTLQLKKSIFSYSPSRRPDTRLWTPNLETQSPMKVWTA